MRTPLALSIALAAILPSSSARADGSLEGMLDLGVRYQHSGAEELEHSGVAELTFMVFPGRPHALCLGLEADAGVAPGGLRYRVDGYPLGYQYRGQLGTLSLCAGGGVRGLDGVLPPGWRGRLRGDAALDLQLIRVALELGLGANVSAEDRPDGALDEWSLGLRVHYRGAIATVQDVGQARGPFFGVTFERYLEENFWGLTVGYGHAARNF